MANIIFTPDEDYESEGDNYLYSKCSLPEDIPLLQNKNLYNTVSFEDFLRWTQMGVKSIDIKRFINAEGKPEKKFNYTSLNPNSYEVYLPDDWYCIDIDVWMRHYPDFVSTLPFTLSSTKKRHYYCKISTDVFKALGTRQPVKVLDFPMTPEEQKYNNCERGYGDILKKMWEPKDGIMFFPKGMENLQNAFFKISFNRILPYVHIPQTTLKEEATQYDDKSSNSSDDAPESCYNKMLNILGRDWYEPFDNWSKVLWCLPKTENCKYFFHQWSKKCPSKYDEHAVDAKWEACRDRNPYGFQTLLKYCRIENLGETEKLQAEFKQNKRSDEKKLVYDFTNTNVAKYFYQSHKLGYIYFNATWHELNHNGIWIESMDKTPHQLRTELFNYVEKKLIEYNVEVAQDKEMKEDERKNLHKAICKSKTSLGSTSFKDKVIKELESLYLDRNVYNKMNNNRNLWAFNNCLVDLTTGIKRSIEPSDYISITCGYDYPELDVEEKTNALKYLKTMFRDEEELLFCLRCMASCLRGENYFNKLFTFIGGGGNGKGCFFDAFQQVFGKYWGVMPMEYWNSETSRDATRADVNAVSSLYKRVLYSVESDAPDDGEKQESKLCVSKIKKWTGGDIIKCRDNYSKSKEQIEFKAYGTILFNTNYPPAIPIKEKNSDAIKRRLIIHEFPFTFVDDIQSRQIEEGKTFKVGNPEIKKQLQSDKIKNALIHILLEIYNKDINGKSELELPESTKNSTKSFIGNEDKIVNDFMTETFERTSDDKDVVKREAIFMFFKDSDYYVKSITAMMFYNILERIKYNKSARNIIKIKYKKEEAKDKKEEDEDHNTSAI